jgi:DHA2 family methylenomycin A resistance protein-like MFS transporter
MAHPMLPLGFFRSAAYSAANAAGLVMGFVVIGLLFLFALFFQQVQGGSAIAAGLRFMPLTAAFVLAGAVLTAGFIPGKAPAGGPTGR